MSKAGSRKFARDEAKMRKFADLGEDRLTSKSKQHGSKRKVKLTSRDGAGRHKAHRGRKRTKLYKKGR